MEILILVIYNSEKSELPTQNNNNKKTQMNKNNLYFQNKLNTGNYVASVL